MLIFFKIWIKNIFFISLFYDRSKDRGVHTFLNGISPKVNVIALLEFELATTPGGLPPPPR